MRGAAVAIAMGLGAGAWARTADAAPPCNPKNPGYNVAGLFDETCPVPKETSYAPDDVAPLFHVAAGIGGAAGAHPGFRANVDLAADIGFLYNGAIAGFSREQAGPLLGGTLVTGFGKYPTSVGLNLGYTSIGMGGWMVAAGPAVRVGERSYGGGELRAQVRVLVIVVGAHAVVTAGNDTQITGTIGIGLE